MSSLGQEVDDTLSRLDAQTAARFERMIRDAVALVRPASAGLDPAYFDSVIGAFAEIEFERPPQGDLPAAKVW